MPLEDVKITISKETILKALIAGNVILLLILSYIMFSPPACGDLPTRGCVVNSGDGRCQVVVGSSMDGAGVWVRKPGAKQYAYMYAGSHVSPYIALGDGSGVDPLVFYLHEGKPAVQLKRGNTFESFDFEDLLKTASPKPIGKSITGALPPE